MTKIIINPDFESFRPFIEKIPSLFENENNTLYKGRNELKILCDKGTKFVVKSFKKPHFINRIIYTFLRKSKAERSFNYGNILIQNNIPTPTPIAYIEVNKTGLLSNSYYISEYSDYPNMLRDLRTARFEDVQDLIKAFACFSADFHKKGILHKDYSPGNILYKKNGNEYVFCLVDINRMKFGTIDMRSGCENFKKLWGNDEMLILLSKEYAKVRGFDESTCVEITLQAHKKFWKKYMQKYPTSSGPYIIQTLN